MRRHVFLMAGGFALIAQPIAAAVQAGTAGPDRELHEIVFKNYPPRALAAGEEGPVFFNVTLDKDAHPTSCEVTHGSGHPLLDEETCDLIVQHAIFSAGRDANGAVLARQTAEGVVNWTIPGHAPAAINLTPAAVASKPDKQICKRTTRVGTLSSVERNCMTATEWARRSDEQKLSFEEMQGKKGFTREDMCQGPQCDSAAQMRNIEVTSPR